MRNNYMGEYQSNYDANASRSDDTINKAKSKINEGSQTIDEQRKIILNQESCLKRFYKQRGDQFVLKMFIRAWLKQANYQKSKKKKAYYAYNSMHRYRLRVKFDNWRKWAHGNFKGRFKGDIEKPYRIDLESKNLSAYKQKVTSLKLLMASFEDKIAQEQENRQRLARDYELSLNVGANKLNKETEILSESPLVREISLIVAKELL